jgi:hypothetical protein
MQRNRPNRLATEPKAWWQRVAAGERLPKGPLIANSKCEGTVEDPRNIALDVREMIRKRVFEQPVGSVSPSREQCCYAAPDVAHLRSHHRRDFRNRPCRSRRRNRVPTQTPAAPSASAAAIPRPSAMPPAAITGVSPTASTIAGTRGNVATVPLTWPPASPMTSTPLSTARRASSACPRCRERHQPWRASLGRRGRAKRTR